MRIFVVDDSKVAALSLQKTLAAMGHEVVVAAGGPAAWEHLQRRHERLVLTDWMMPELDGLELCRRIRSAGLVPYTYVVVLSVKDLRKDRLQALEAGADDFLIKPADSWELSVCLRGAQRILAAHDAARAAAAPLAAPALS
jgi:DNA-binding response OmpR family regulator